MRLCGNKNGVFDETEIPRFEGYRVKSVIQFSSSKQHFRTIRNNYGINFMWDGYSAAATENRDWERMIYGNGEWEPYIVSFIKKQPDREYLQNL